MNETNYLIAAKGLVGTTASAAGVVTSVLPAIETWVRMASLMVGLLVGVMTLLSLLKNYRAKKSD